MLHRNTFSSPRVTAAVTLLLPACGILVARALLPDASARAASDASRSSPVADAFTLPNPDWIQAMTRSSEPDEISGSPFFLPDAQTVDVEMDDIEPDVFVDAPDEVSPPPNVRVSAIMRTASGQIAMIDGKAATIGVRIATDWLLAAIDEQRRTITLQNESDGREIVVALEQPF
jgi:hypothetical protein